MLIIRSILAIVYLVQCVFSARILGIIPTPSISHQIVYRKIWTELSLRGHEVVVVTTDPIADPRLTNLTEINLHFSYGILEQYNVSNVINDYGDSPMKMMNEIIRAGDNLVNLQLEHPEIQSLIRSEDQQFDLVMVEVLVLTFFAFKHKFQCPLIGLYSLEASSDIYNLMGNPVNPITNPDTIMPYVGKLTFMERLSSVLSRLFFSYFMFSRMADLSDKRIQKYFGDYPPILDLVQSTDMLFLNVHPAFLGVRPLTPSIINIGIGLHLEPLHPLPKVLKIQMKSYFKHDGNNYM